MSLQTLFSDYRKKTDPSNPGKEEAEQSPFDVLMTAFLPLVEGLLKEEEGLQNTLDSLGHTNTEAAPLWEAKGRVLLHEIDNDLSQGRMEKAESKRAEMEQLKVRATELSQNIEKTANRLLAIQDGKLRVAKKVFSEVYPSLRAEAITRLESAIDSLAGTWDDIQKYSLETGANVPDLYRRRLPPQPLGEDRFLYEKIKKWLP